MLDMLWHRLGKKNTGVLMTNKQLHLMKILSYKRNERISFVKWSLSGVTDEEVMVLQDLGFLFVENDGFKQELRLLYLTREGHQFIESFCEACECMPCDCNWGYE